MNKIVLSLIFILISFVGLAQQKTHWKNDLQDSTKDHIWANQINRIVNPKYVLLKKNYNYSFYDYTDINNDGQKEIIATVSDTIERDADAIPFNKIFIFKITNKTLEILDSSGEYEVDGRGPQISVNSDSLIITHGFHHGYDELIYEWNNAKNKYLLATIVNFEIEPFSKKGVDYTKYYTQTYEVSNKTLTMETEVFISENEKKIQSNKKIIPKKLPSTLSLLLKDLKDPSEYDDLLDPNK